MGENVTLGRRVGLRLGGLQSGAPERTVEHLEKVGGELWGTRGIAFQAEETAGAKALPGGGSVQSEPQEGLKNEPLHSTVCQIREPPLLILSQWSRPWLSPSMSAQSWPLSYLCHTPPRGASCLLRLPSRISSFPQTL